MSKSVKSRVLEGGTFTLGDRLTVPLDPNSSATDLYNSYLEFQATIKTDADHPSYSGELSYGGNASIDAQPSSQCLIRHVKLDSSKKGVIEERNWNNVLMANLKHYQGDRTEQDAVNFFGSGNKFVVKDGEAVIRVPMRDLLGVASEDVLYPASKMGDSKLHIELESNNLICNDEPTCNVACNVFTPTSNVLTTIETTATNWDIESSNVNINLNQNYTLNYTQDATAKTKTLVVSNVNVKGTGELELAVSGIYPAFSNANACTAVFLTKSDAVVKADSLTINDVHLVQMEQPKEAPEKLKFMSWESEGFNMPSLASTGSSFQKQWQISPNCDKIMLVHPESDKQISEGSVSYRNQVDGFFTTDSEVEQGTPLYNDKLLRVLEPNSLQQDYDSSTTYVPTVDVEQFGDGKEHQLLTRLTSTGGSISARNVYLFKNVEKEV